MNNNILKTFVSCLIYTVAIYPLAFAADSGSCGTNCQYTYDHDTETINIMATGPNATLTSVIAKSSLGLSGKATNINVGEGIVKIQGSNAYPVLVGDTMGGKLVLPSTLKYMNQEASWGMKFGEIEINSTEVAFDSRSFRFWQNAPVDVKIIMPASNKITFNEDAFDYSRVGTDAYPGKIEIICKGDVEVCQNSFGNSLKGKVSNDVYSFTNEIRDKTNKVTEAWDSAGNHLNYSYDSGGNLTAAYKNGIAIYRRTQYTPAEAAAAANRGKNNTVTLTFK